MTGATRSRETPLQTVRPRRSPEVELLYECARTHVDADGAARIGARIRDGLDWERLLQLANSQGVGPLVLRTLRTTGRNGVPAAALTALEERAQAQAQHNEGLAAELAHALALLEAERIPVLVYKSLEVGLLAYQDQSLRPYGDVDLLVQESDVGRAKAALLSSPRYRPTREYASSTHINTERVRLDLHWRVAQPWDAEPATFQELRDRSTVVSLLGTPVPTLAVEDLLLVLAIELVRDARVARQRLVQLCDAAELLRSHPELDWDAVLARARRAGAQRLLLLDVWMAHVLLGAPLRAAILDEVRQDPAVRGLAAAVESGMLAAATIEPGQRRPVEHAFYLQARERLWDKLRYVRLQQFAHLATPTERDRAFVRLPSGLSFLYILIRPVRVLGQWLRVRRTRAPVAVDRERP